MFRKFAALAITTVLVGGALSAAPASAATKISNGVACSKSGATTKVNGFSYRCARNSMVKNSKLTWLSFECLTAISQYNAAVKDYATVGDVSAQGAALDAQLTTANAALTKTSTALDTAKAQLESARAVLLKTTNPTEKTALSAAIQKLANAVIVLSTSKSRLAMQVQELATKKAQIVNAPGQLKQAVTNTKSQANSLCAKGF